MRLRFAGFLLDLELGTLQGPEGQLHLRPQTFRMLEILVHESPRILGTEELLNKVWGTEHLSESSVRQTISELRQTLGDSAARPRIIETVHRRGYRMIAEVERLPAQDRQTFAATGHEAPATPIGSRIPFEIVAILLLALWVMPQPNAEVAVTAARPSIAILGLEGFDATSQMSWLPAAIRETLRFELEVEGTARLIRAEEVEWASRRLGLEDRSLLASADLRRLGRRLGASWVIHGSYVASDASSGQSEIQIQLQIRETTSGEVVGWAREKGSSQEILEIVGRLLRSVRGFLSADTPPAARHVEAQHWLASSGDSLRLFAQGAEALARREALAARGLLEQAAAIARVSAAPVEVDGAVAIVPAEQATQVGVVKCDSGGHVGQSLISRLIIRID